MKFITIIKVPIISYFEKDVYFYPLYFTGTHSPTKSEVEGYLSKIYPNIQLESPIGKVLFILSLIDEWADVSPSDISLKNIFVETPWFGKQPITFSAIKPIELEVI